MANGLIGRKIGMTQIFDEEGHTVPVTVVEAGPCYVTQVKTMVSDGYDAIQLGFEAAQPRKLKQPQRGHLKDLPFLRHLREWRVKTPAEYAVGQKLDVSIFAPGERVSVTGTSKGKGFQGVVKRHGFRGGPQTHGQSDRLRAPGSIGSGTTLSRVQKGRRMPGRMGGSRVTVPNLLVVRADPERNLLLLRGAVPGPREGLLLISKRHRDA
jgi:large subunit ribosomal protein L3